MIEVSELFTILFYILLMVLVICLIVLAINAIKTLNKVDKLVDDINSKSAKLNGVFSIIDSTTDAVVGFSDSIVGLISNTLGKIFYRKKEKENE